MPDLTKLTLGRRIQALRKEAGLTQEALAEKMGITAQAVSKWENDLSCPDIMTLPLLCKVLHTTADTLLTGESAASAPSVPAKKPEELVVRMTIVTEDGDRFQVNLPFTVFRLTALHDMLSFTVSLDEGEVAVDDFLRTLQDMDLKQLVRLIEDGARGVLADAGEGNRLTIWVE